MSIVALQGHDGELYPNSVHEQVPQSFSTLNIDAFAAKAEGSSFDKCQDRTTQEAVDSTKRTSYGLEILDKKSTLSIGRIDHEMTGKKYQEWVKKLSKVDDDTADKSNEQLYDILLYANSQKMRFVSTPYDNEEAELESLSYGTDEHGPIIDDSVMETELEVGAAQRPQTSENDQSRE